MRIILFIAFIALSFSSCNIYKDIETQEVSDIRITKMFDKGIFAELDIRVFNPNNFKVSIVAVDGDIYLNDKNVGNTQLRKKVILGKKSNEIHTIKIEGDYTDMRGVLLQTLIGGLFSQSMNIKVEGSMKGKALLLGKSFYFEVDQDVKMN
ncbi:MAG: LEA type 2 family protein [Flavobacteriales bacterium]